MTPGMTSDDTTADRLARRIAEANGISMLDDRLPLFAASLARNVEMMRPLLAIDFGATEPASRFRPGRASVRALPPA